MLFKAILIAFTALAHQVNGSPASLKLQHTKSFVAFGDSYTSHWTTTYGDGPRPASGGGSASGGPAWIQYLAKASDAKLRDFAIGGATVDASILPNHGIPSFVDQTDVFLREYPVGKEWSPESTRFAIWFGINNIGQSNSQDHSLETNLPRITGSMLAQIQRIYGVGGRHFLILNIPPTWRSPAIQAYGPGIIEYTKTSALRFNVALSNLVNDCRRAMVEAEFTLVDTYSLWTKMLDAPLQYGFKNTTATCDVYANTWDPWEHPNIPACGLPLSEYFYASGLHPSYTVHRYLSDTLFNLLT